MKKKISPSSEEENDLIKFNGFPETVLFEGTEGEITGGKEATMHKW